MTQRTRDDRLLGVLCLTARTSIARLPTTTPGTRRGALACAPGSGPQRPPVVRAVKMDTCAPALRGLRGREDRACCDSEAPPHQSISPCFEV